MLVLEVSGNWLFFEFRVEFPPNLACLPRDYVIESTWDWDIAIIPAVPKITFVTPRPLGFGGNWAGAFRLLWLVLERRPPSPISRRRSAKPR